jgi:hypothetical protein
LSYPRSPQDVEDGAGAEPVVGVALIDELALDDEEDKLILVDRVDKLAKEDVEVIQEIS